MSTENYYIGTKNHPYHLSVGGVVVNDEGKVLTHYFDHVAEWGKSTNLDDFYILMRETVEMGETLEDALHRGLMEEFGVEGDIVTYLGSIQCTFQTEKIETLLEKTTPYFLVRMNTFSPEKRKIDDPESGSELRWEKPDFLIPKMREQGGRLGRSDVDESLILERLIADGWLTRI